MCAPDDLHSEVELMVIVFSSSLVTIVATSFHTGSEWHFVELGPTFVGYGDASLIIRTEGLSSGHCSQFYAANSLAGER